MNLLKKKEGEVTMAEQLCPVRGCAAVTTGYEKEGAKYYCEPCPPGNGPYECEFCHMVEETG